MKICTVCKENKEIFDFHKRKISPDGLNSCCKKCKSQKDKLYKQKKKNKTKKQIFHKKCGYCKIEKDIFEFNKDITSKDGFQYSCKICKRKKDSEYRKNNKEKIKKYKQDNKEKFKIYRKNNRHKMVIWERKYRENPSVKIVQNLRSRMYKILVNKDKSDNTLNLIGCSVNFLKNWLKFQFKYGMNWENYGSYWQIDHVNPCSNFSLNNEKEQRECFHWTNLQPLESFKNNSKNNKIIPQQLINQEIKVFYYKSNIIKLRESP